MKRDLECKRISCDSEEICFVKIGIYDKRYEWILVSVYLNCEGIRGEENVLKMQQRVKDVVSNAKAEGLKIMIGGDMNAHIWELDKCENKNGILLKSMVVGMNLPNLNCIWESMKDATCFFRNSEFTLDYICVNDCALKCIESAYILDRGDVVEIDHAAVRVDVDWKMKIKQTERKSIIGGWQ